MSIDGIRFAKTIDRYSSSKRRIVSHQLLLSLRWTDNQSLISKSHRSVHHTSRWLFVIVRAFSFDGRSFHNDKTFSWCALPLFTRCDEFHPGILFAQTQYQHTFVDKSLVIIEVKASSGERRALLHQNSSSHDRSRPKRSSPVWRHRSYRIRSSSSQALICTRQPIWSRELVIFVISQTLPSFAWLGVKIWEEKWKQNWRQCSVNSPSQINDQYWPIHFSLILKKVWFSLFSFHEGSMRSIVADHWLHWGSIICYMPVAEYSVEVVDVLGCPSLFPHSHPQDSLS